MITIVFPFDEGEMSGLLHDNDVAYKMPEVSNLRFDEDYDLCRIFIDIIESPFTLPSLATIIVNYLRKDSYRKASIKNGDIEIDLSGRSTKDVEKLLNNDMLISIINTKDEDYDE